jgi:hypothetical protein
MIAVMAFFRKSMLTSRTARRGPETLTGDAMTVG